VIEIGAAVTRVRKGDRVAVSPCLSCAPRGLPACASCRGGDYPLCHPLLRWRVRQGHTCGAPAVMWAGLRRRRMSLHESIAVPDPTIGAVRCCCPCGSLRGLSPRRPRRGSRSRGRRSWLWCGSVGVDDPAPASGVVSADARAAITRRPEAKPLVERLGANALFTSRRRELICEIGEFLKAPLRRPLFRLPWLQSGVHRIYTPWAPAKR